jgi:von Willebrand factor type A domain
MCWRSPIIFLAVVFLAAPAAVAQVDPCAYRSITVSVQSSGSSATQLTPADFSASMNQRRLTIVSVVPNSAPVRVIIALDASGSMTSPVHSWGENLDVAEEFLKRLPASSLAGLVVFADRPEIVVRLTLDRDAIHKQLEGIRARHKIASTALWDNLASTVAMFGPAQPGDVIYLLSDGDDDASRSNLYTVQSDLGSRGIRLFMISLGTEKKGNPPKMKERQALVEQLVRDSGGSSLRVPEKPTKKSSDEEREAVTDLMGSALLSRQFKAISEFDILRVELPQPMHESMRWDLTGPQRGPADPPILFPRALPACPAAPN